MTAGSIVDRELVVSDRLLVLTQATAFMGLDGGTYITRSDVLRGQSWDLATADNSRSTRGGDASTSAAKDRRAVDPRTIRFVAYLIMNSTLELTNPSRS